MSLNFIADSANQVSCHKRKADKLSVQNKIKGISGRNWLKMAGFVSDYLSGTDGIKARQI